MSTFERCYRAAVAHSGDRSIGVTLAGRQGVFNTAGAAWSDIVLPAFAHLRDDSVREPELTVYSWDAEATGVGPPDPLPSDEDFVVHYDAGSEILTAVDREARTAFVCVRRSTKLPEWEYAHPLRHAIATWARSRGLIIIHSAAIGDQEGGVLVTGPGGSGKSTTALSWIASGGRSVGDDYVLIEPGTTPIAHSLFATMRLYLDHAARFSGLLPGVDRVERQASGREKATVNIAALRPGALARSMPVQGLLVARVTGGSRPRIAPLAGRSALLELMRSSMTQFLAADADAPAGLPVGFRVMADLCRVLPCGMLEIGGDPFGIPAVLAGWLGDQRPVTAVIAS